MHANKLVSANTAMQILRAVEHITTSECALWQAHETACNSSVEGAISQAEMVKRLGQQLVEADVFLHKLGADVVDLPLFHKVGHLQVWLRGVQKYHECLQTDVLSKFVKVVTKHNTVVDEACPRWGTCITDDTVNVEVASLSFSSEKVASLPSLVDKLWASLSELSWVGCSLGLGTPVDQYIATRSVVGVAMNSLEFGKRTVTVAAAFKLATDATASLADRVSMSKQVGIPKALFKMLTSEVANEAAKGSKASGSARVQKGLAKKDKDTEGGRHVAARGRGRGRAGARAAATPRQSCGQEAGLGSSGEEEGHSFPASSSSAGPPAKKPRLAKQVR
mmetsp:Transcript_60957/g.199580  ORF Transcript_60957/g.199580 Transcript_60957/m.199580 type:complete len:335 (-) Transcript_60957:139-1143(-)|eukprot:CAMPEP_0203896762 /NCGR_PEP_ID=MMETSP0359-20131031/39470_1 /ASSEMBLY_ACC=CAM_ASM_000338 /TAXON_ID=268821 /ORGANISM="Scrippsiella Hangoei, Strain SHTV-5" /LENGTH=334 /DNA_ID=CAMNT_0050819503 /DNA_START=43 /DNA_END=1047 /DNA_ORIENTATION=-